MALSPNYSWAEPDNSSLVKNGASDIRTLGDAIDTSVWNVGYGQAAKNKCINGAMAIAQRGTSIAIANAYCLDMYRMALATAVPTGTVSQQTFTPGAAPVAGYEAANYMRANVTANNGSTLFAISNRIEDVRTFAGQVITVSFYAKADAACTLAGVLATQNFGSGGSTQVATSITMNSFDLTTGWARYTGTVTVPSVSGKTIGTGSYIQLELRLPTSAGVVRNGTYDLWGYQAEYGSKATPFQTATGTIQGELAACQRYYYRVIFDQATARLGTGYNISTTQSQFTVPFPTTMRTRPTALEQSGTAGDYSVAYANTNTVCSAVPAFGAGHISQGVVTLTVASGLTTGDGMALRNVNTDAYLGWSAEL